MKFTIKELKEMLHLDVVVLSGNGDFLGDWFHKELFEDISNSIESDDMFDIKKDGSDCKFKDMVVIEDKEGAKAIFILNYNYTYSAMLKKFKTLHLNSDSIIFVDGKHRSLFPMLMKAIEKCIPGAKCNTFTADDFSEHIETAAEIYIEKREILMSLPDDVDNTMNKRRL